MMTMMRCAVLYRLGLAAALVLLALAMVADASAIREILDDAADAGADAGEYNVGMRSALDFCLLSQ